jgi:hypothetical protein
VDCPGRGAHSAQTLLIFGARGHLYRLAVLTLVCGWCGNPAAHTLRKRVTKFALFFVPLFPFSTKYATQSLPEYVQFDEDEPGGQDGGDDDSRSGDDRPTGDGQAEAT